MDKFLAFLLPFLCFFLSLFLSDANFTGNLSVPGLASSFDSLCAQLIEPNGYFCSEHTVQTKDGYLLALQRVSSRSGDLRVQQGHPVLLQHGLFMAGDAWFLDSTEQSLGFILADQGFDVWVGNVRGTRWSHGHISLLETDKEFWEWSWQELALYDLAEMLHYIHAVTSSKVFIVGHSQGTIMSLAALTQSDIVEMVEAAALLSPISYLEHVTAPLVLRMVAMHLDQMVLAFGLHQLNFRSDVLVNLVESLCDGQVDCNDFLSSITGFLLHFFTQTELSTLYICKQISTIFGGSGFVNTSRLMLLKLKFALKLCHSVCFQHSFQIKHRNCDVYPNG